jgi:drug/metabolite transporter (DMT)-like permease
VSSAESIAQTAREPEKTRAWTTHLALLVVQLAFASQAVEGKVAMGARAVGGEGIAPYALAMARMAGAALFFQVLTRATRWLARTTWRDQAQLAVLSVLGIALNQTLFLIGLRITSPMSAALLGVTIPVLSAGLAVVVGQERGGVRLALGIGVAIGGVLWLTGIHAVDHGAVIVLLNCVSYSAYIVFSRGIVRRLGAVTVVTWIFTWGALLFAPLGAPALIEAAPGWSARGWTFVGYIVVVPTIVAYLCNAWALGRSSATLVTIYIYVQPLITALLAWIQLRQAPTSNMLGAAVLIVIGVSIVATRRGARPAAPEE